MCLGSLLFRRAPSAFRLLSWPRKGKDGAFAKRGRPGSGGYEVVGFWAGAGKPFSSRPSVPATPATYNTEEKKRTGRGEGRVSLCEIENNNGIHESRWNMHANIHGIIRSEEQLTAHVIDINMLQCEELGHWLAANTSHIAILTDFAMVEIWACKSDENTLMSFSIIKKFPSQVLKMYDCNTLRRGDDYRKLSDVIDIDQTESLRLFMGLINTGYRNGEIQEMIHWNRVAALKKLIELEAGTRLNRGVIETIGDKIRPFVTGRTTDGVPEFAGNGMRRIKSIVFSLASEFHKQSVKMGLRSYLPNIESSFEARFAAAAVSSMVLRLCNGSFAEIGIKKARNDIVDCNHMACASYFNGFQTRDDFALHVYNFMKQNILNGGSA